MCRSSAISIISATSCCAAYPACAEALAKYRINPGNVGFRDKRDKQFSDIIEIALKHDKPVRIGVNWGSLDQELLARMMDENAKAAKPRERARGAARSHRAFRHRQRRAGAEPRHGRGQDHPVGEGVAPCRISSASIPCSPRAATYALHLGLTEAGMGSKGIVASAAALGILLQKGIGDTIRVSLTPEPGGARTKEVEVAQQILQTMGFRTFVPIVAACPGCGRTTSTLFQEMARDIQNHLLAKMPEWRKTYPGVEALNVAVMGCIVNGPGESKHADIGISLPGTGESPAAPVFIDGQKAMTLRGPTLAQDFMKMVEDYIEKRFGQGGTHTPLRAAGVM